MTPVRAAVDGLAVLLAGEAIFGLVLIVIALRSRFRKDAVR